MVKIARWKFWAILTLAFVGTWNGVIIAGKVLGLVTMPDDALLFVKFLHWLTTTPWWVPAILTTAWMIFLAVKLWDNELTEDQIEKRYSKPHREMLERQRVSNARILNAFIARSELEKVAKMEADLNAMGYDLRNVEQLEKWCNGMLMIKNFKMNYVEVPYGSSTTKFMDDDGERRIKGSLLSEKVDELESKRRSAEVDLIIKREYLNRMIRDAEDA